MCWENIVLVLSCTLKPKAHSNYLSTGHYKKRRTKGARKAKPKTEPLLLYGRPKWRLFLPGIVFVSLKPEGVKEIILVFFFQSLC